MIDNATGDNSVAIVVAQFENVSLIASAENLGYGRAINKAVLDAKVSSEWILITNPDTEFTPGAIDALVAGAESNSGVGSAGPRIVNDDGTIYPSARALPSLTNGIGHALFERIWPANPWTRAYQRAQIAQTALTPTPTGWLSGACVLVRREAFEKFGGFDSQFFMYFETSTSATGSAKPATRTSSSPTRSSPTSAANQPKTTPHACAQNTTAAPTPTWPNATTLVPLAAPRRAPRRPRRPQRARGL